MSTYPDNDWLKRSNAKTLSLLEQQARTGPGLVPFLGAGVSKSFGYDDWKTLLTKAAPPRELPVVRKQLEKGDYEEAAETLLRALGPDGFQNMVAASAGDSIIQSVDFRAGSADPRVRMVSLLPLLTTGPVVTTNFDRVVEHAFAANGATFKSVISGPRPDLIVDALHGNRRVLIKLHGDWQDRVGRTFAKSDYDANYGTYDADHDKARPEEKPDAAAEQNHDAARPEEKRVLLENSELLLFSSRSLLFIGASLGPDRTVKVLKKVHEMYAGIRHFTITVVPKKRGLFDETVERLKDCGVLPLWYQAEDDNAHATGVMNLVAEIVERVSVQTLPGPKQAEPAREMVARRPVKLFDRPAPKFKSHFDRVVPLIKDGQLTFVLGSAVHLPTKLMAKEFYDELARTFKCEALINDRDAVAQYIADRHGRDTLYGEIDKMLARTPFVSRNTHELFAAWGTFKTAAGAPAPYPLVLTTNYDDILERRLADAGIPYHLLSYHTDGTHRGLFYHQLPDNSLRVIERPHNIRELPDPGFVIVKLNGGLDWQKRIPVSYATARLDYFDLAARIPDALPAVIRQKLSANPLLFLGHGLAMPDVESLIRFAHKEHPGPRSWAIALRIRGVPYWRQCGVEVIDMRVHRYVNELHARLAARGRRGAPARAPRGRGGNRAGKSR